MIRYSIPSNWIRYDALSLISELTEAKSAVLSLTTIPFQRSWADKLQDMQLKREVAGTSRIEGAEFTEGELEVALRESAEGKNSSIFIKSGFYAETPPAQ